MSEHFDEYARDESRFVGNCTGAVLAKTPEDIAGLIQSGEPFAVQGAKTGIAGACVPDGCKALSLSGFSGITGLRQDAGGGFSIALRPGTLLCDLRSALEKKNFATEDWTEESKEALARMKSAGDVIFGPDPTEETATVGGLFATNAGGPATLLYGRTGDNTTAIDVRLADGALWHVERGAFTFDESGNCPLPDGRTLSVTLSAGAPLLRPLQPTAGSDLVDLFAGSEGMLGVVEQIWLKLLPKPAVRWSVVFFPQDAGIGAAFCDAVMAASENWGCSLSALEYLDARSLALFSGLREKQTRLEAIPQFPAGAACAVMAELCADDPDEAEMALGDMLELFAESGGDEDATWAADTADEIEKFRLLRHAVPEAVNTAIDRHRVAHPVLTKLAADICLPGASLVALLPELMEKLNATGMDFALFGHAGERHFHVNLIPKDGGEYAAGGEFARALAAEAAKGGGVIAAENGVGKLKRGLLQALLPGDQLALMRQVKSFFDPAGILNPNNML